MTSAPQIIAFDQWDERYIELKEQGLSEPWYGGPLRRHAVDGGDMRLPRLKYDNSAASLRLWNFLLTEEERLHQARSAGRKIVGTMKDLGTVPVMAFSHPNITAFYPDGAWWTPCIMESSDGLLAIADSLGIDESFCPVRAMLGAFVSRKETVSPGGADVEVQVEAHFPIPDLLVCSVGATCDDFAAIARRLNGLGHPILWWEVPHRRHTDENEDAVELPGGFRAPSSQVDFVRDEFERLREALSSLGGSPLDDCMISSGIRTANRARRLLAELRRLAYTASVCPLPALEMQIAEMLIIHFCSDREETIHVYEELLREVATRVNAGIGVLPSDAVRVYWVNPVADLRAMNILEDCGGRVCGTEYLFCHALDQIPENIPPMEALARSALADPMVGSSSDRAQRICRDIRDFGAEAVVISRIPGASHCALEGTIIGENIRCELGIPVLEIEVPPLSDSIRASLTTRLEAMIETVKEHRR
ncbi:MAG TPA: 2-hydroxyacyl-CoA dehydratase family protein [Armatimonadota bacterium]|jgi:benzoyl-CoA reductase/2-hydroxyglutaryl-CoA dehydratase subunit BcrC/BadD/HgdB